jgi:hypothetical protein
MQDWNPNEKGTIAELAIQLAAARLKIGVYKPVDEHSRADLLFEIGDALWRVQVKWARLSEAGDVIFVHTSGNHSVPGGMPFSCG